MWILDPNDDPYEVRGFQVNDEEAQAFRVLSVPESQEREVHYGADVGTVTLTVFRERAGRAKVSELSDEAADVAAVGRMELPPKKDNYKALKASMLADANRGLIAEGQLVENKTTAVSFIPDPTPEMTATIVYYWKRNR